MLVGQILAVIIFLGMFLAVVALPVERCIPAILAAFLMIVTVFLMTMHSMEAVREALSLDSFTQLRFWLPGRGTGVPSTGINWGTILFIAGMMVMVEGMGDSGFFRWLCLRLAKAVRYQMIPLFFGFIIMSAVLAMFIDSITVILFLAAVSIELAQLLKFDPVPLVIAEIFTANLGGSATMSGDPPNIIIGTSLGLCFKDFLTNTGTIAMIAMLVILPYFYLLFRKELKQSEKFRNRCAAYPSPSSAITSRGHFLISVLIFTVTVTLLITHDSTGLSVASIGVIAAAFSLLTAPRGAFSLLKRVDWKTLIFFTGLFVTVSGLEQTGVLHIIAQFISHVSRGSPALMLSIIIWISAAASAFVDNIPFAATMVPVIRSLAITQGVDLTVLAWALSLGTDIGGSATPIGASANVVGTAVSARQGHPITWGRYCKIAVPATILTMLVITACMLLFY